MAIPYEGYSWPLPIDSVISLQEQCWHPQKSVRVHMGACFSRVPWFAMVHRETIQHLYELGCAKRRWPILIHLDWKSTAEGTPWDTVAFKQPRFGPQKLTHGEFAQTSRELKTCPSRCWGRGALISSLQLAASPPESRHPVDFHGKENKSLFLRLKLPPTKRKRKATHWQTRAVNPLQKREPEATRWVSGRRSNQ